MITGAYDIAWLALVPTLLLVVTAIAVMLADLFTAGPDREGLGWIGIGGLVVTALAATALWGQEAVTLSGALTLDRYGLFFTILICVTTVVTLLLSMGYLPQTEIRTGDYYTLVLFATVGMVLMAVGSDLLVIFLALEVMSIAAYALAGIARGEVASNEAALKYFLLGAFASGFLLFGMALVYGATGSTTLVEIQSRLATLDAQQQQWLIAGLALLLVGFGFKVAAAPFHVWTPDVYEGAPTSVTAFMAVGIKAAAFAALGRLLLFTFGSISAESSSLLWVLAVATMTVGNVTAVSQRSIKRMLAYSSIAHAGYLLMGLAVGGEAGGSALLFYLVVYGFMTLGAFAVVAAVGRQGQPNENLDDYAGLGFRRPFLALAMSVFMLSLAGIPPLAGFLGKFYLFGAAIEAGFLWLPVIGVLNSLVSVYYYAGVLVRMYMSEGGAEVEALSERPLLAATLVIALVAVVALGLFPNGLYEVARAAMAAG